MRSLPPEASQTVGREGQRADLAMMARERTLLLPAAHLPQLDRAVSIPRRQRASVRRYSHDELPGAGRYTWSGLARGHFPQLDRIGTRLVPLPFFHIRHQPPAVGR